MLEKDIEQLSYGDIVNCVEKLDRTPDKREVFKISFFRNITIDLMVPYIKFLCYQDNIRPRIDLGNYDTIMQDITGSNGKTDYADSNLIIVCMYQRMAARKLYFNFSSLSDAEVEGETTGIIAYIDNVLSEIRRRTHAPILIHNFEIPVYPAFGILDYQHTNRQVNAFRRINQQIIASAGKHESVYVLDMDLLQSRHGSLHITDERFWHMARAPYSREGYFSIAREYMKFIRSLRGRRKKCLVLDCDNTLWGGIIGEDGLEGIQIGQTYPGSAFREFQEAILNLYNRGVLLALCSKNNPEDVEEVLDKHPDMVLRRKHFVSVRVNWGDKASNIKQIAKELDIGLDSLVFVDDNEFETNMVKSMVPEVNVLLLPKEPAEYRRILEERGYFDCVFFSEEDKKRSEMYRAEAKRREAKEQFGASSIEEYLKFLEMEVNIGRAGDFHVPRISQLTQRTNQFNLTTRRYAESDIKRFMEGVDSEVFYVSMKDRFGDNGVVGAAVMTYEGENAFVDVFLLSCRVIGRGIEDALLKVCVDEAIQRDCENIFGTYIPTKKNSLVAGFYDKHGFSMVEKEETKTIYVHSLSKMHMAFPPYFKLLKVGDVEFFREEK